MQDTGLIIAFTGGGSGGHIQPIVSLIEYAQNHNEIDTECKKLYWFGEENSHEKDACAQLDGVDFISIASGKIRRYRDFFSIMKNIRGLAKVLIGFSQSLRYLKSKRVSVVFSKGGYVALPVCLAAWTCRIPIIMHESDMRAGLTNRIVAKLAHARCVGSSGTFDDEVVTGQILSDDLSGYVLPERDPAITHVLVMGGSQGAATVYTALASYLQEEDVAQSKTYRFYVLLGTKNQQFSDVFTQYAHVTTYDFVDQTTIAGLYAGCDLAITRGSMTSLAEQQLFGIKKIIVSLPRTGANHQFYNALWYSDEYEDILLEQDDQLVNTLSTFLTQLEGYKKMWDGLERAALEQPKEIIWTYILKASD